MVESLKVDTQTDSAYLEGKGVFDKGTVPLGQQGGIQVSNGGSIAIDSKNPFSSGCPADYAMTSYKGTELKIPLSRYCNIFEIMGNIMLLVASLISIKIIMKVD
jgi:hypothetical protein